MNAIPERLWYLVSLQLAGEASAAELAELQELLRAHPEAALQAGMMRRLWQQPAAPAPPDAGEAFQRHLRRLREVQPPAAAPLPEAAADAPQKAVGRYRTWAWAAVAATVLASVVLWLLPQHKEAQAPHNVVSTRPGSKSKVELPDGTVVWLNSGSRLLYDEAFHGSRREVRLEGEAYFDVAKDPSRPFIIHTRHVDLKVLGTAFNLRAYPDEGTTETALIHGSVEVLVLDNPDKKIVLKPSEKLVVHNKQEATAPQRPAQPQALISITRVHPLGQDSTLYETSWVANRLAFDNEPLEAIAKRLERWYDVSVVVTDPALKQTTYTADFEGESLEDVLQALQLSGGFKYHIQRREVYIKP